VPAAAVIPAPLAYTIIVAVKRLVVGLNNYLKKRITFYSNTKKRKKKIYIYSLTLKINEKYIFFN